jgi:hypothetical protein
MTDLESESTKLRALRPDARLSLGRIHPTGALLAWGTASGHVKFFFRYNFEGQDKRDLIGFWDSSAHPRSLAPTPKGYSIAAARHAAGDMALLHHTHKDQGGLPALNEANVQAVAEATAGTLGALCDAYVKYKEGQEKVSVGEVRSAFNLHVKEAFPRLADMQARLISGKDIASILARLVNAGKGPTSNKLRAYLHAAYELALIAETTPKVPKVFQDFSITENPVKRTRKDADFVRSHKENALEHHELKTYWQLLNKSDIVEAAMLRLHLLTGAQRIAQFVRLRNDSIKTDSFILKDGKGRGGPVARNHLVPLTESAQRELAKCRTTDAEFALSLGRGTHISASHLSRTSQRLVGQSIPDFELKRVRSGVETLLSRNDVLKEIRGRLQSHGIGGVQDVNYDFNDFFRQKLTALQLLEQLLIEP